MSKQKLVIIIAVAAVIIPLLTVAGLTYIPRTQALSYDMYGYIISPEGDVLEQFSFKITGTAYDFIIDPPGGGIHFSGNEVTKLERDAHILYFEWGSKTLSKDYYSGHFSGDYWPGNSRYISGTLVYYSAEQNRGVFEQGMLDLEGEAFCMYSYTLAKNAFIVGLTDPDGDPHAVIEDCLSKYIIRDPESAA